MGHAERSHALLSASGAHRWMSCTPSALLEAQFPDTTSEAAEEGTLAHELCELKLRNYFNTVGFGKRDLTAAIRKLKKNKLWQDEMMGYTDEYVDYIKSVALGFKNQPYVAIEKRWDLSAYVPKGFGTADCTLIGGGVLHIVDFKYGKSPDGRVSAEDNPQLLLYALGAYEAYKLLYKVDTVRMTIVQPRLSDGTSEFECSLQYLLDFGKFARQQAAQAAKGEGEFKPTIKTCRYCRARARCRARADMDVKLAFLTDTDPRLLSNAELGGYLLQGRDVAKWLKDVQDLALAECLAGKEVPGWKAVEGRGLRDWTDLDAAFKALTASGLNEAVLWERKPLSVAQAEKVVGKKDFQELVGAMVTKKPGSPALVEESDKRDAITNKITASEAFKEEN